MTVLSLAWKSLLNRGVTVALTLAAIALSVMLLLGVEKLRTSAREGFATTVSDTDLIVGARGGSVNLLLYSVFRIGNPTANIDWRSYQDIAARPEVAWTIPLSLGDSHRGFRVLGTSADYFRHFRYGRGRALEFGAGRKFDDLFDAVVGADVARTLGYELGQRIVIEHGIGGGFANHEDKPFRISGILKETGTPVDRTVHVSLEAIEAIHADWRGGARVPGMAMGADAVRRLELTPRQITAVMVGLKSRIRVFSLQRDINTYRGEPLVAIMPGVALQELWSVVGTAETALSVIAGFVVATGLLGMATMLLASLNERRREMAVLRSVGARPHHIFALFAIEATALSAAGAALGFALVHAAIPIAQPLVESRFGLYLDIGWPTARDGMLLMLVVAAGFLAGLIPALRAYRSAVAVGIVVRS